MKVLDRVLADPHADAAALRTLMDAYAQMGDHSKIQSVVDQLHADVKKDPGNFQAALALAEGYRHLQQPDKANQVLNQILAHTRVGSNEVLMVAQSFAQMSNFPKLEASLNKLTSLAPDSPEAWYDLAALEGQQGRSQDALSHLRKSLVLSAERRKQNPRARDLKAEAQKDSRFGPLPETTEFQELIGLKRIDLEQPRAGRLKK